jgi:hypothetical protein
MIQISSIYEFQKIGNDPAYPLDGEYELTQDIDASDTVNWNDGKGFEPIGTQSTPFTGKFDGKGYKITRLYIKRISSDYIGLFGKIGSSGIVKNVGIDNAIVFGVSDVGVLIGVNKGMVSNCYSKALVFGCNYIGGLIGSNEEGTVSDSFAICEIIGGTVIGGLIGANEGTISDCYSIGSVSGALIVGSLIGDNTGTVSDCYSTGTVNGDSYTDVLVGCNEGRVMNSYMKQCM